MRTEHSRIAALSWTRAIARLSPEEENVSHRKWQKKKPMHTSLVYHAHRNIISNEEKAISAVVAVMRDMNAVATIY